jgi:hypothetical protein
MKKMMRKILIVLLPFVLLSCSSVPSIQQYNLSSGTKMYFISATTWKGNGVNIVIDFNFKDDMTIDTICNINITQKDALPRGISAIILKADTVDYALKDVQVLVIDSEHKTVRITSTIDANDFLKAMMSNDMTLNIAMNNQQYQCKPSDEFLKLKNIFVEEYIARGEVLK